MRWVECTQGDFSGEPPSARSGHSAVVVNGSMLVVFGGLRDSKFLGDVVVLDIANKTWFHPECRGGGPEGEVGPGPRAFHVAVSIDCHMFIFGGRSGRKRQGDFWMLDTDTWQWVELTGYGDLPPPRDFAAGVSAGNGNLVICGGSDGNKWTSDVYVLNTISLEWTLVRGASPMPPPRCAHAAVMVENRHGTQSIETRLLMFGGRAGGGGPILGDLWVFKGVAGEESPAWTKLTLPGPTPAPRCGHSMTPSGTQVWIFGGQSTGGWLTRYDIYYNDSVVLDRASGVQWKRPNISNEPPPARAYHTMTAIGNRFLLFGGYNGKTTFGDAWFLVPEDDPLAKRMQPRSPSEKTKSASSMDSRGSTVTDKRPATPRSSVESKDDVNRVKGLSELRMRLGLPPVELASGRFWDSPLDGSGNAALVNLGLKLMEGEDRAKEAETRETTALPMEAASVARKYLSECEPTSLRLCQLQALLDDYRILVAAKHEQWRVREQCQQQRFARRKKKKDGKDDEVDNKERSEVKELSAERSIMPPSSVVSTAVVKVSAPSSNSLCSLFYRLRRLGSRKGDNCSDNSSNRKKRSIAKWLCCRVSVIADLAMHPCGGDRRRTLSRGQMTPASVGETPDSVASSNHQWPSQTPSPFFSSSLDKTPVARHHFYHLRNASQVRLDDIPKLLEEYRQLLRELHQSATPSTGS